MTANRNTKGHAFAARQNRFARQSWTQPSLSPQQPYSFFLLDEKAGN
ncbi:hypothetical protein [Neisseria sicca]|nr:hypothetical protein [Neisseria sicca]